MNSKPIDAPYLEVGVVGSHSLLIVPTKRPLHPILLGPLSDGYSSRFIQLRVVD